jgi:hypothetical protein
VTIQLECDNPARIYLTLLMSVPNFTSPKNETDEVHFLKKPPGQSKWPKKQLLAKYLRGFWFSFNSNVAAFFFDKNSLLSYYKVKPIILSSNSQ